MLRRTFLSFRFSSSANYHFPFWQQFLLFLHSFSPFQYEIHSCFQLYRVSTFLNGDEIREMTEQDNRLEEELDFEVTHYEFSKCRKPKIEYTRALLLGLSEAEVCHKLPCDFDLLTLRQFDGGSDTTVEQKSICSEPFDHNNSLLTTTWSLAIPAVSRDNHLHTQSKESHLKRNCSLAQTKGITSSWNTERKDVPQLLPQKSERGAGILHCQIEKSDLFQLSKAVNPYVPPHLNKKISQPLPTFYEPGVESLGESEHKDSADDITGHDKSGNAFSFGSVNDLTKEPVGKYEDLRRNGEEYEVIESSERLDEYEDSWRKNEGNEVIAAEHNLKELMEDNQSSFDDFWAEILETIHLQQQEPNTSPTNNRVDSELGIHLPGEESLISVDTLLLPENLNSLDLDELNLPDEDSLISVDDMLAPDMSKNSNSACSSKAEDRSKRLCRKAQPSTSRLVTRGRLPSPLPHSQTPMHMFGPAPPGSVPLFITPNVFPYFPSLNCFTHSGIHLPFAQTSLHNTKTNYSVSNYSLLDQPNILPYHLLYTAHLDPKYPMDVYDVDVMHLLPSSPQEVNHETGTSKAGK